MGKDGEQDRVLARVTAAAVTLLPTKELAGRAAAAEGVLRLACTAPYPEDALSRMVCEWTAGTGLVSGAKALLPDVLRLVERNELVRERQTRRPHADRRLPLLTGFGRQLVRSMVAEYFTPLLLLGDEHSRDASRGAFRRPRRRGSRAPSNVSFVTIPPVGEPAVGRDEGGRAKVCTVPKGVAGARDDAEHAEEQTEVPQEALERAMTASDEGFVAWTPGPALTSCARSGWGPHYRPAGTTHRAAGPSAHSSERPTPTSAAAGGRGGPPRVGRRSAEPAGAPGPVRPGSPLPAGKGGAGAHPPACCPRRPEHRARHLSVAMRAARRAAPLRVPSSVARRRAAAAALAAAVLGEVLLLAVLPAGRVSSSAVPGPPPFMARPGPVRSHRRDPSPLPRPKPAAPPPAGATMSGYAPPTRRTTP
ncbi:hypothetical protein CF166_34830 [Amycolatopsis sp. KNN50.9b]|nr:hypothetical protein CF166_34830 [Amycolatopsis sp. KNN50.9b]